MLRDFESLEGIANDEGDNMGWSGEMDRLLKRGDSVKQGVFKKLKLFALGVEVGQFFDDEVGPSAVEWGQGSRAVSYTPHRPHDT